MKALHLCFLVCINERRAKTSLVWCVLGAARKLQFKKKWSWRLPDVIRPSTEQGQCSRLPHKFSTLFFLCHFFSALAGIGGKIGFGQARFECLRLFNSGVQLVIACYWTCTELAQHRSPHMLSCALSRDRFLVVCHLQGLGRCRNRSEALFW